MRYRTKKTGHEKTPISELLEFTNKKIDYTKDKERDKQSDMKEELEQRYPFSDIKTQIDRQQHTINHLQDAVKKLLKHKHTKDGETVIDIEKGIRGYFA